MKFKKDPLIAVIKEATHFDLIPRVPLIRIFPVPSPSSSSPAVKLSDQSSTEKLVCLSHFSKYEIVYKIILTCVSYIHFVLSLSIFKFIYFIFFKKIILFRT